MSSLHLEITSWDLNYLLEVPDLADSMLLENIAATSKSRIKQKPVYGRIYRASSTRRAEGCHNLALTFPHPEGQVHHELSKCTVVF